MSTSAITTYDINTQYVGDLALLGAHKTPILNLISGGAEWVGRFKNARDWEFPLNSQYSMDAAAQPAITETDSLTAPTPKTYTKSQDTNCCQIFHRSVNISYAAQSAMNKLTSGGLMVYGEGLQQTDLDFQIQANLKNLAMDLDKTIMQGAYQAGTDKDTAWKTRGLTAAISTNAINGGGDALTTTDIENAMIALAETKEAPMEDLYLLGNASTIKKVADLYGVAPMASPDNTLGGGKVETIITQFGRVKLMWEPNSASATILIVDAPYLNLVGLPVPGKGVLFYEDLPKTGANTKGQIYGQLGLGYTMEEWHAKITNFT